MGVVAVVVYIRVAFLTVAEAERAKAWLPSPYVLATSTLYILKSDVHTRSVAVSSSVSSSSRAFAAVIVTWLLAYVDVSSV